MTLNDNGFKGRSSPVDPDESARAQDQTRAALVASARKWAAVELHAAMAHELNGPVTALLLYLHSLKRGEKPAANEADAASGGEMLDMALREAERICAIMERIGGALEPPMETEAAVARGRDAIDAWLRNSRAQGIDHAMPPSSQDVLTLREREVLGLIIGGASNKEGAYRLGIGKRTFEVHRAHIMEKVGAKNAADLVRMALSRNW